MDKNSNQVDQQQVTDKRTNELKADLKAIDIIEDQTRDILAFTFTKECTLSGQQQCNICQDGLEISQKVIEHIGCRQRTHATCFAPWIEIGKVHKCPTCRDDISADPSAQFCDRFNGANETQDMVFKLIRAWTEEFRRVRQEGQKSIESLARRCADLSDFLTDPERYPLRQKWKEIVLNSDFARKVCQILVEAEEEDLDKLILMMEDMDWLEDLKAFTRDGASILHILAHETAKRVDVERKMFKCHV